jgi:hypothetical protein
MPFLATGITTVTALGWGWLSSRTSMTDVAPRIAEAAASAKAAQIAVLHCDVETSTAKALAIEVAKTQLELWGQAEVDRAYPKTPHRAEYIERARRYYLASFDAYLDRNPNDPATALRRARQSVWRPDRDD